MEDLHSKEIYQFQHPLSPAISLCVTGGSGASHLTSSLSVLNFFFPPSVCRQVNCFNDRLGVHPAPTFSPMASGSLSLSRERERDFSCCRLRVRDIFVV
jgi:hypothetical protein